ncbi:MAG: amidohydrolase family protein [Nitriliruptorales bacterium]|nr:amidohydrolase family protein [Nitriliruptorales bacterium]
MEGANIYAPGAVLSTTGGHGDIHAFPVEWVTHYGHGGGALYLADGVPECLRAVRAQLRLGAKVIKVCASGGVLSELDDPIHQQFSEEELRAIVAEGGTRGPGSSSNASSSLGRTAAFRTTRCAR